MLPAAHQQQQHDRNKLYSLPAPEVECLAKGKAHKRYEFGVKVSIAATNKSNFVVGAMALSGNPYDGHTLTGALEQVRRMSGQRIDEVFLDRGYRGHGESLSEVYISGQKRGITTQRLKRSLKRRQAIEPIIGHLKSDGLLGRNYLKGTLGDQMNVLLCCAGHNLRLILKRLRFFCLDFWGRFRASIRRWEGENRLITEINSGAQWLQRRSTKSFAPQFLTSHKYKSNSVIFEHSRTG